MQLHNLNVGLFARVQSLDAEGSVRRRLLDLGFVPGTKVEVLRKSPLGDPTLYHIRGAMIALREEEAELVNIVH